MPVLLDEDREDGRQRRPADALRNLLEILARVALPVGADGERAARSLAPVGRAEEGGRLAGGDRGEAGVDGGTTYCVRRRASVRASRRKRRQWGRAGRRRTDGEGVGREVERGGLEGGLEDAVDGREEDVPEREGELQGAASASVHEEGEREGG